MRGHDSTIWCLAYSPDDRHLLSGGSDNTVRVWAPKLGQIVYVLQLPGCMTWAIGWHRAIEGRFFVGSTDGRLGVYQLLPPVDIKSVAVLGCDMVSSTRAHSRAITGLVTSDIDFDKVVTCSDDSTIAIWNLDVQPGIDHIRKTIAPVVRLAGHIGAVLAVCLNPADNNWLASAGEDMTIRLWDVRDIPANLISSHKPETVKLKHQVLNGHTGKPKSLVFNLSGELLISAGEDCTVRLWYLGTGSAKGYSAPAQLSIIQIHSAAVTTVRLLGSNCVFSAGMEGHVFGFQIPKKFCQNGQAFKKPSGSKKSDAYEVFLWNDLLERTSKRKEALSSDSNALAIIKT